MCVCVCVCYGSKVNLRACANLIVKSKHKLTSWHINKDDIEHTKLKQQEYKREKDKGKGTALTDSVREIEREARKHILMILEAEKILQIPTSNNYCSTQYIGMCYNTPMSAYESVFQNQSIT